MTSDWSEQEETALAYVAEKDEWDREVLDRAVRQVMFDGVSFARAVPIVLGRAIRPEPEVTVKVDELKAKLEALRAKQREKFSASKQ